MGDDPAARRVRCTAAAPALAAGGAAMLTAVAYWPGMMTWDAVRQYGEAVSGRMDDWHPPAMQWLWRQLIALRPGPAPMLVLQLALYWGGLALLAIAMRRQGRSGLGWALLGGGLQPLGLVLMGVILKDCLMTGALLVATGLLALRGSTWTRLGAAACLLFAATLRFNSCAACLPLMVAVAPAAWRRTWPRFTLTTVVAATALLAALPAANRLIGAAPSGVELSLVLFDLGGITDHAGVSVFPEELEVRDPVAVNRRCYRPDKWDSYSDWVTPECPLGFSAWNDNVDPAEIRPYPFWLRAVLSHPAAYARHRLTHFAINIRLMPLAETVERPVPQRDAPNQWGFRITANALSHALDALAMATARTPLGWPIVWLGLALGALDRGRAPARAPG